jgi:hypothetical protein
LDYTLDFQLIIDSAAVTTLLRRQIAPLPSAMPLAGRVSLAGSVLGNDATTPLTAPFERKYEVQIAVH